MKTNKRLKSHEVEHKIKIRHLSTQKAEKPVQHACSGSQAIVVERTPKGITVALKTADGGDHSANEPVFIKMWGGF